MILKETTMNTIRTTLVTACLLAVTAVGVGCSAADTPQSPGTTAAGTGQQPKPQQSGEGQPAETPQRPGVSGTLAEITGQTMQVQGQDGQTAVTWTDATTFTPQVTGGTADITVGSCVMATGDDSEAVSRVLVTPAVDGACTMGIGAGRGGGGMPQPPEGQTPPSGMPSGRPTDLPSDLPSGIPAPPSGMTPDGGPGAMTAGLVTAVEGATVTVSATVPAAGAETTSSFTLASDAEVTTSVAATSDAAVVGACVSAQGEADDTGAVTATSVSLSEAVDGECGGGFR